MTGNGKLVISQSASGDQPDKKTSSLDTGKYVEQRSGYVRSLTGVVEQEQALKKVALDQGTSRRKSSKTAAPQTHLRVAFRSRARRQPHQKCTCSLARPFEHSFVSALVRALPFSPTRLHLSTCV